MDLKRYFWKIFFGTFLTSAEKTSGGIKSGQPAEQLSDVVSWKIDALKYQAEINLESWLTTLINLVNIVRKF